MHDASQLRSFKLEAGGINVAERAESSMRSGRAMIRASHCPAFFDSASDSNNLLA